MVRTLLVLGWLAAGCKSPATAPDAGTPVVRGNDIRSAVNVLFPEYRGVSLVAGRAQVSQTSGPAGTDELTAAQALAEKNGFHGEPLMRSPFVMEQRLDGRVLHQEVRLGLSPDELARILAAPSAMSSEALGHWLPKVAPRLHEEFEVELLWVAKDVARADFLVWQLVDGAVSSGWTVAQLPAGFELQRGDAGVRVPEEFSLALRHSANAETVEIERKADRAKLRYSMTTYERR